MTVLFDKTYRYNILKRHEEFKYLVQDFYDICFRHQQIGNFWDDLTKKRVRFTTISNYEIISKNVRCYKIGVSLNQFLSTKPLFTIIHYAFKKEHTPNEFVRLGEEPNTLGEMVLICDVENFNELSLFILDQFKKYKKRFEEFGKIKVLVGKKSVDITHLLLK